MGFRTGVTPLRSIRTNIGRRAGIQCGVLFLCGVWFQCGVLSTSITATCCSVVQARSRCPRHAAVLNSRYTLIKYRRAQSTWTHMNGRPPCLKWKTPQNIDAASIKWVATECHRNSLVGFRFPKLCWWPKITMQISADQAE